MVDLYDENSKSWDVLVVGKGNAALCAALSSVEQGASVAIIEAAPEDEPDIIKTARAENI